MTDVRVLLATHAHWDHVAGLAELKRQTKAPNGDVRGRRAAAGGQADARGFSLG